MTRFARAKGSKSSNERVPNEATPWHIMKQQLGDSLAKAEGFQGKVKTAKELLKEKDEPFHCAIPFNINNDWAEFEQTNPEGNQEQQNSGTRATFEKEDKNCTQSNVQKGNNSNKRKSCEFDNKTLTKLKMKKSKANPQDDVNISSNNGVDADTSISEKKKKKRKNNALKNETKLEKNKEMLSERSIASKEGTDKDQMETSPADTPAKNPDASGTSGLNKNADEYNGKLSKRQKRNTKRKNKNNTNKDKEGLANGENKDNANNGNVPVKRNFSDRPNNLSNGFKRPDNRFGNKFANNVDNIKRKPAKIRDDLEHKRRKPENGPVKMTINGIEVEIVKYDGFPVKKEDADRLKDLKQQMILKGIPKGEIAAAMKLERRKAEKALTRVKKCVCFHCRKAGHVLSDCPELEAEQAGTGICFKCGSTEHTHFECKVAKATEYRYASCFICREQGHIAKQCPDNPKGIYPQGGACKICGDVTHLKKDCPDLAKEKEDAALTLDTIAHNSLESLGTDAPRISKSDTNKSKNKIVKF